VRRYNKKTNPPNLFQFYCAKRRLKTIKKGFENQQISAFKPFLYAIKPQFVRKGVLLQANNSKTKIKS